MGPSIEQTFCLGNTALYMESIVYLLYCIVCVLYIGFVQWFCISYIQYIVYCTLDMLYCKYRVCCTCVLYTTVSCILYIMMWLWVPGSPYRRGGGEAVYCRSRPGWVSVAESGLTLRPLGAAPNASADTPIPL